MDFINTTTHIAWHLANGRFVRFHVDVADRRELMIKEASFINAINSVVILLSDMTMVRVDSFTPAWVSFWLFLRCFTMKCQSCRKFVVISTKCQSCRKVVVFSCTTKSENK